ncbi:hypothetical protein [Geofilum rhodophaeum]|uniref:hypothetical protein n=1 Tax=Geofilum rhodophaeum TaxID=1965019 RepID=UPI0011BA951E|nr:hypothetical protein [Geofilum rhodophaeum]
MAAGLQGLRCRLFPAPSVRWLKAGNSPSAQTARLFTLHFLQSLYRKQSEACPCSPSSLCDPPGLLSFFKLVYHHCRFVALGRGLPPPGFFRERVWREVLVAAGLQGLRCRLFPAPSVRWLKAGNSPSSQTARLFTLHFLQALYRKQSEACPCSPSSLCDPPGLLSFFKLVYHHCRFVALGRGLPPPGFFRERVWREVLVAAGLQGLRCRLFPAPSVRWLKAGNSPSSQTARLFTLHFLQALYRKQSEACPCSPSALCDLPGCFLFSSLFIATADLSRWAEGFRHRCF